MQTNPQRNRTALTGPPSDDPPQIRRPATWQSDGTQSQKYLPCSADNTELVRELQAASLRRRFAIGYYFATTVAPLIWGLPR
jgi:hypothetical protein